MAIQNAFYLLTIADADNTMVLDSQNMPTAAERRQVSVSVRCVRSDEHSSRIEYVASLTQRGWHDLIKSARGGMRESLKAQRDEELSARRAARKRTAAPAPCLDTIAAQDGQQVALKGIGHTLRTPAQVARGLKLIVQHRTREGYRWTNVAEVMFQRWYSANRSRNTSESYLRIEWFGGYQRGIWERIEGQRIAHGGMP